MLRKILMLVLAGSSLILATSAAPSSGTTEPEMQSLGSSEAVLFPKVSGDALDSALDRGIQQHHADVKAYLEAVAAAERERQQAAQEAAEREAAEQAAAEQRAQEEREAAEAPPPAQNVQASGGCATNPDAGGCWDKLAQCESGGNWSINTGNGYYGGIQFSLSSWRGVGGTGYPHEHSRETQIEMGRRLWNQGGWAHWPACTAGFGWR